MPSAERASLTYAFDAYCAWCYGFGPTLRTFAEDNAHRIRIGVVSAGLYTGARALPVSAYPHLSAERGNIARLTGVAFGTGHDRALSRGTTVLDSAASAAGLAALRDQPGISELDAAEAMQRAWFVDGRSLSDAEVYRDIAGELGLDADAVTAAYSAPAGRVKARADFRALRRLRVRSYPTLLLDTAHGADQMGGAGSTAASLTSALDQRLTTTVPQVPIHDLPSQGEPS
ncbi:DsbA family protein [Streptomyces europaeiscabiei]|uniref:DsbA family protein n=1 Tax=Streptomyces TaxID=1883 RepID=UPI0015C50A8C|nr:MULTISPECIES: DsbA family protein [Streptomyces]MDX3636833.1 DsbA family protein [Streptomyces europaeiscabiei]MDX3655058.1 DsbA family protein [Streptomyces europaeiscabiei]